MWSCFSQKKVRRNLFRSEKRRVLETFEWNCIFYNSVTSIDYETEISDHNTSREERD